MKEANPESGLPIAWHPLAGIVLTLADTWDGSKAYLSKVSNFWTVYMPSFLPVNIIRSDERKSFKTQTELELDGLEWFVSIVQNNFKGLASYMKDPSLKFEFMRSINLHPNIYHSLKYVTDSFKNSVEGVYNFSADKANLSITFIGKLVEESYSAFIINFESLKDSVKLFFDSQGKCFKYETRESIQSNRTLEEVFRAVFGFTTEIFVNIKQTIQNLVQNIKSPYPKHPLQLITFQS